MFVRVGPAVVAGQAHKQSGAGIVLWADVAI